MSDTVPMNYYAPPRASVDDVEADTGDELEPATRGSRLAAAIIDSLPYMVFGGIAGGVGAMAALGHAGHAPPNGVLVALVAAGLAAVGYFIYNLVLLHKYGQSFGKKVMGIRIVRTNGARAALRRIVFLRSLPMFVLGAIPHVGYLVGLVDSLLIFRASNRCLHDNIADTCVATAASSRRATLASSLGEDLPTISF